MHDVSISSLLLPIGTVLLPPLVSYILHTFLTWCPCYPLKPTPTVCYDSPSMSLEVRHSDMMFFYVTFYITTLNLLFRFDEVHFARFTTYFLNGTFFFDLNPPFGKLVFASTGMLNFKNKSCFQTWVTLVRVGDALFCLM